MASAKRRSSPDETGPAATSAGREGRKPTKKARPVAGTRLFEGKTERLANQLQAPVPLLKSATQRHVGEHLSPVVPLFTPSSHSS